MYTLTLKHHFSSAHQLTNAYTKACNDYMHGHNWEVQVTIKTPKLINGMVIDFTKIKETINKLDHKTLNEILDFEPTAENIAKYLHQEISKLREDIIVKIKLWETPNSSIEYQ